MLTQQPQKPSVHRGSGMLKDMDTGLGGGDSRAADDRGGELALAARDGHLVVQAGQEGRHVAVGQPHKLPSVEVPLILGVGVASKAERRN